MLCGLAASGVASSRSRRAQSGRRRLLDQVEREGCWRNELRRCVAIPVVLSPSVGVGALGMPVKFGEAIGARVAVGSNAATS